MSNLPDEEYQRLRESFERLPDRFVVVPNWGAITGSSVYGEGEPGDIDVVIKLDVPSGALLKLDRSLQNALGIEKSVQFIHEPTGPSWGNVPIYDLVAVKRNSFNVEYPNEPEFVEAFYKATPGKHVGFYKAWNEFFNKQEEELWERWASKTIKGKIVMQPKADGIRLHLHKKNGQVSVFTEMGNDQAKVFPGIEKLLESFDEVIIDVEALEYNNGSPESRWEMAWMGSGNETKKNPGKITFWAHDLLWYNGKDYSKEPYYKRLKKLSEFGSKTAGNLSLKIMPTKVADSKAALAKGLEWASGCKEQASEGAMLKSANFKYGNSKLSGVAKYKSLGELNYQVIGHRKLPRSKQQNIRWTRDHAMKMLPELLKQSRTYIFRLALKSGDGLIPMEANHKLTKEDLNVSWDEEQQEWTGLHDPKLWHMFEGWENRKEGEYAYGQSYAVTVDDPSILKKGLVLSLRPGKLSPFKGKDGNIHLSHQHPVDPQIKSQNTEVSTVEEALKMYKLNPQDYEELL